MSLLNEKVIKLINTLTCIPSLCQKFIEEPGDGSGEEIISLVEECDDQLDDVKREMVEIVKTIKEESTEINGTITNNGIKLGDSSNAV